jgi:catechol 2,3-dioxygenase-like lactoylglutathione lyase family enzyme
MPATPDHERPAIWVGHVALRVADVAESTEFYHELGLRLIAREAEVGILELRGGTHLILLPAESPVAPGTVAPFDFMVDDVDGTRKEFEARGLSPSEMRSNPIHRSFTLPDPSGYSVVFNSSHVGDKPV